MEISVHQIDGFNIAEVKSEKIIINNVQDSLDLMAEADNKGARKIIIREENICQDFFKLGTGLAGEILQKFVNYHVKLAVVGNFKKYGSKNFKSFVYESNNGNGFFFVSDVKDAINKLAGKSVI